MATFNLNIKSVNFDSNVLTSTRNPRVTILEPCGEYSDNFGCFYGLDDYNPASAPFTRLPNNINFCQFVGEYGLKESYLYTEIAHHFFLLPISDIAAEALYYKDFPLRRLSHVVFEFYAKIFDYNDNYKYRNEKA